MHMEKSMVNGADVRSTAHWTTLAVKLTFDSVCLRDESAILF